MTLECLFPQDGLALTQPRDVWRMAAAAAFERAQRELELGRYVAGYMTYEGEAILGSFDRPGEAPGAGTATTPGPLFPHIGYDHYRLAIDAIQRDITDGEYYQINYTAQLQAQYSGDALALWQRVGADAHAPYRAFIRDGESAFASWSPELFLEFLAGGRVRAKPMKGTAMPHDETPLHDRKNRAEHIMIVDLLRNDLRRFCDDVTVSALCTIERYPTFSTMTSTVEGVMRDGTSVADAFTAAFPCGSITGAPKRAAMQAIATYEGRSRGIYCGTIGFFRPDGTGWWNVAIRTAHIAERTLTFGAGGGIVADSTASAEWDELHLKANVLRAHCEPFEILETFAGDAADEVRQAHLARMLSTARDLGVACDRDALAPYFMPGARALVRVRLRSDGTHYSVRDPLEPLQSQRIIFSDQRVSAGLPRLRYKTSVRPEHDAAWQQARVSGAFDALIQNQDGFLAEGARSTLFVERDGILLTPPVADGALPGILRGALLQQGRAREARLRRRDLHGARIFAGNSARGLVPVTLAH